MGKTNKGFFITTDTANGTCTIYRNGKAEVFFPTKLNPQEYKELVDILKGYYDKIKLIDENGK